MHGYLSDKNSLAKESLKIISGPVETYAALMNDRRRNNVVDVGGTPHRTKERYRLISNGNGSVIKSETVPSGATAVNRPPLCGEYSPTRRK